MSLKFASIGRHAVIANAINALLKLLMPTVSAINAYFSDKQILLNDSTTYIRVHIAVTNKKPQPRDKSYNTKI